MVRSDNSISDQMARFKSPQNEIVRTELRGGAGVRLEAKWSFLNSTVFNRLQVY